MSEWYEVVIAGTLYLIGAGTAIGIIALMLYIPTYFR